KNSHQRFALPRAGQSPNGAMGLSRDGVVPPAWRRPARHVPVGLGPELVPSVEVVKVLPTISNTAVLELEDDAVADIQALAVPLRGAALHADYPALVICKQVLQLGLKGAPRLLRQLAEVSKRRVAALVIVSEAAPPRQ